MIFHDKENMILHQLFDKNDCIFHLQKDQKKNFSILRKHDIPCYRKYHPIVCFEN